MPADRSVRCRTKWPASSTAQLVRLPWTLFDRHCQRCGRVFGRGIATVLPRQGQQVGLDPPVPRDWFAQGFGGVMAVNEAFVGDEWVATYQVIEPVQPGDFVHVMDQTDPEASQGFMETVCGALRSRELTNAINDAGWAKLGSITTQIYPRQPEVVAVMEGAVRESARLESPQERGVLLVHRSVSRRMRVDVENPATCVGQPVTRVAGST